MPEITGFPRAAAGTAIPDCTSMLAIETCGLRKSFGGRRVLDGADLQVPEGLICTVMGPPGAGKTVLFKHILGVFKPDTGEVLVRGRKLSRLSRSEIVAMRRDIGVMFQDGALLRSMAVFDNVAFPLRQHTDLDEAEIQLRVDEQLDAVGLLEAAYLMPADLSTGMRKRAALARALVLDPGIVLCDEPNAGLDPVRTALLGELLSERHAQVGGTMVVVTHDVELARRISNYVAILWRGRIVAAGPADDLWSSEDPFVRHFLRGRIEAPVGIHA